MWNLLRSTFAAAALLAAVPISVAHADPRPREAAVIATPAERGALIRAFVRRWGGYVQQTYGVDVGAWSLRMVPTFAYGDSANLREALRRDTFEGALAALNGRGARIADDRILNALAAAPSGAPIATIPAVAKALGDTQQDLVFTPIQPCRIVDTRLAGGAIGAGTARNFRAAGATGYANQGGSGGNCGMQSETPTAVALNVTAVFPAQAGFATVYPFGTARPDAASVNYAAGAIVNNSVIARIPNPAAAADFSLFSFAQSDYVVDIVGFFAPPRATALSCLDTAVVTLNIGAGGLNSLSPPQCPAGYTATAIDCESSYALMPLLAVSQRSGLCTARNNGPLIGTLSASRRCCRVPGR